MMNNSVRKYLENNVKQWLTICLLCFITAQGTLGYAMRNVCTSKDCLVAAEELKSSINLKVDPCENFYEFACGGWKVNHPVPPTDESWSPFHVTILRVTTALKDILESSDGMDDPTSLKSARMMYRACMDNSRMESRGLKPMIELTERYGGWPLLNKYWSFNDFDWQVMLAELKQRLLYHPIVSVGVAVDFKNSTKRVIYVDQPSLVILRRMLVSPELFNRQITAYKQFIVQVAKMFLEASSGDAHDGRVPEDVMSRISDEVDEMVKFETELAEIMSPPELRRDRNRMYNKMTIQELQNWSDSASTNRDQRQTIDWLKVITITLENTNLDIGLNEEIVVFELEYVVKLIKLIERTPLKSIVNYLHWRLVDEFINDLTSGLRKSYFRFRRIFTGAAEESPRWKECVRSTETFFGFALGYKYTQLHFDENSKKSAVDMVTNLQATFVDEMEKVSWMDDSTREAAKEKVHSMKKFIGFPDFYTNNETYLDEYYASLKIGHDHFTNMANSKIFLNLKENKRLHEVVDQNEWPHHESPVTVNAFYNPSLNAIVFPAGVLQNPFFSKGRPDALNYGAVGEIIGHEITHGFDDLGRQYDKFGNLVQWWTEHTINAYLNQSKCFIEQYDNFTVPELEELMLKPIKLNGLLTLGENMADNGGLYQAYTAYKRSHLGNTLSEENPRGSLRDTEESDFFNAYNNDIHPSLNRLLQDMEHSLPHHVSDTQVRLPGLEMFNGDQLFFLGFASNWCESQTIESLLHEVLSNVHSPNKYRVLGTVANSREFANAFSCPVGSPMNPKKKCSFW